MVNRRLISLQVGGQESTQGPKPRTTVSYHTPALFDCTALVGSGSASTKTTTPKPARPGISARDLGKAKAAQRIVRAKYGDSYIPLTCGHFTTPSGQVTYSAYAVKGRYYCETCGSWKAKQPKPERPVYPDEPPF